MIWSRLSNRSKYLTIIAIAATVVAGIVGLIGGSRPNFVSDPSALELHIFVRPNPYYSRGQSYYADVWEFNPLSVMNNVSTASNWEPRGVYGSGCDPGWPIGAELLKGHYVAGNVSLGSPVPQFFQSTCTAAIIPTRHIAFLPNNSSAIINGGPYASGAVYPTRGTWTYYRFNLDAGEYTVVARDEWGHIALGYFTMTS